MGLRPNFIFKFIFVFAFAISAKAQNSALAKWTAKYDKAKAFIENKGQFKVANLPQYNEPVVFAATLDNSTIYFTKKGLVFSLLKTWKKDTDENEREKEKAKGFKTGAEYKAFENEEKKLEYKTDVIPMFWDGSNPNVQIIAEEETHDYHTYSYEENGESKNVSKAKGYKKITYKNLYQNIDVEYTFHPETGIKYAIVLHPGADAAKIKMRYSKAISVNNKQNLIIPTTLGNIIDHAPVTFYSKNNKEIVSSKFIVKNNTVGFKLGNYDQTQTIIIDPWTQTPTFTGSGNWNCAWECDKDGAGNVYVIGGVTPMQLKKYNNAGVLQWTHNTPYDTTAWMGTMATDNAGNSYVTLGSAAKIQKISTAGAPIWSVNGGGLDEYWSIAFNCDQTKLIVGGTRLAFGLPTNGTYIAGSNGVIFDINTTNGAVTNVAKVGWARPYQLFLTITDVNEVRSIAAQKNSKYYYLTLDSIGYINQNFTLCGPNTSPTSINSTYDFGYKCENYRYDGNNSGIKAIRADDNFVYTQNGTTVHKRSLSTLAILATATIPGGGSAVTTASTPDLYAAKNSGIDIDDCGNVYVGSGNSIVKYDANLNLLSSVATSFFVYDLRVLPGGEVVACGSTGDNTTANRTGTVQVVNMGSCAPLALICCDASLCNPGPLCTNDPAVTLTVSTTGGTFSGPGVNATTGVFNPATAGPGTHTITYTLACGSESIQITVNSCSAMTVCNNGGTLQLTGGTGPYSWASTQTTVDCSACPGGNCIPFLCAGVTVPVWTGTGTSVTAPTAGQFPINVTDGIGTVLNIPNLAGIPACTACPTITVTNPAKTNVLCFGQSTGTATASASGSTTAYTYNWMPGSLTGASQTGLAAGTYTVTATDANSCTGTTTITITQPASAVAVSISSSTPASCGSNNGAATANGTGGTGTIAYNWMPGSLTGASQSALASGTYTVTSTDGNGCTATTTVSISNTGGPTASISSQTNILCFGQNTGAATATATGGTGTINYNWMPGSLTGASQTGLAAGTYTVTATDGGSCAGTTTVTITQPASAVSVSVTGTTPTTCGSSTGTATASATGGTGTITYNWMPGSISGAAASNLSAGTYTVTATDANGCTATATGIVASSGGPTISISSQTNVLCNGGNNGGATASATGGTGTITYNWMPGSVSGASISNLAAGTYTVTATDGTGCSNATTVTITQPAAISANVSTTPATCGNSDGTATVNATGGNGVLSPTWSTSATTSTITALAAGTYTVTITDVDGCTATSSGTVGVTGNLSGVNAGTDVTIISGTSTQLNGTVPSGATVLWTPSTGLSCTTCENPLASPTQTTIYILTASQNGCTGSDTVIVYVDVVCGELFVPTAFSPNEDGQNDFVYVMGNCITNLEFFVYDRWGEKVFETKDAAYGWDGTFRGKKLDAAVFVYYLTAMVNGQEVTKQGNITLIK